MRNLTCTLLAQAILVAGQVVGAVGAGSAAASADADPDGVWPLAPRPAVVSEFDPPSSQWGSGHRGVDLAGKTVVVIDHGATRTTYEPVVATVGVGDVVTAGEPIGRLAVRHSHCLPAACLHWGLIRNSDDAYLDPLSLVGSRRVRLLPFDGLQQAQRPPELLAPGGISGVL